MINCRWAVVGVLSSEVLNQGELSVFHALFFAVFVLLPTIIAEFLVVLGTKQKFFNSWYDVPSNVGHFNSISDTRPQPLQES